MIPQIAIEAFALEVASIPLSSADLSAISLKFWLTEAGYPFLGVEVKLGKPFPLVLLWDDDAQMSRIIACTRDEAQLSDALQYAEDYGNQDAAAGNAPCGCISCGVWPGGWRMHD